MSSEAAPNGSAPETATDASPTAGAAQAGGGASFLDPLGLASFLQKRVLETKTSGQNIAEDITGSRRGTSQPATAASPTLGASQARNRASLLALELGALEEEHSKLSYVSLVGAVHGERWCIPGVGKPPEFLVPLRAFRAEDILGKYLVKLTRQQEGWALLRDETTGELVLSLAPVSAFVGGGGRPYMYGTLARIANDEGVVFVMFDHVSPPAHFEDIECADLPTHSDWLAFQAKGRGD